MPTLPIYNCYHPVLRKETEKIGDINDEIRDLAENMIKTIKHVGNGVGLAANQVGESKSMLVVDLSITDEDPIGHPLVVINPEIIEESEEEVEDIEGCLSIPDYSEKVVRPRDVTIKYRDLDGNEQEIRATDFLARVLQHEIDHLHGKLIFDRITPLKRALSKSKLRKIERGQIVPHYAMVMPDGTLIEPDKEKTA